MFKKIKKILLHIFYRIYLNSDEKLLIEKLEEIAAISKTTGIKKSEEINVAIQMPENYFFLIKFYLFYIILKERHSSVKVGLIQISDSLSRKGKISKIQNSFLYDLKWKKIYKRLFKGEVVFNFNIVSTSVKHEDRDEAKKIFSSYISKNDVLLSKHKDYQIGALVYNYYLRITNEPTVDLRSNILFEIVLNTVRSINCLEEVFKEKKYDMFLTSYITYTVHGIPALVALKQGAKVFAFAGLDQFYKEISPSFFTHVKNYLKYQDKKKSLTDTDLAFAREKIESRFNGAIDVSTSYMPKSSYSYKNDNFVFDRNRKSVVIYLHCFFDSPHIYRNMLFPDFYEWLQFTLKVLSENQEFDIYIKKHPGASEGNDAIVEKIVDSFTNIRVIPHDFNNIQIANDIKPLAVLTVYGTVAHEMAYMGIPVVCAGDNPHIDFEFQITPSTISEYEQVLRNIQNITYYSKNELEFIKKEVLSFYYLHNCYPFFESLNQDEQSEYNKLLKLFRDEDLAGFVQNFHHGQLEKILMKLRKQYLQEIK